MKKIINSILVSLFCLQTFSHISALEMVLPKGTEENTTIKFELGDYRKTELVALKKKLEELIVEQKKVLANLFPRIEKAKEDIRSVDTLIKNTKNVSSFVLKKQEYLKQIAQLYSNIDSEWQDIISKVKQHISLLELYVKDLQHNNFLEFEKKSFHLLSDLQELNERIALQEEKLRTTTSEKNEASLSLSQRKTKVADAEKTYKEKQKEQSTFSQKKESDLNTAELSVKEQGALLDLQVLTAEYEYKYALLQVKSEELHFDLVSTRIDIEEKRLVMIQKRRDSMSRISLRVDEKDIIVAKKNVEKKQKEHFESIAIHDKKISQFKADQRTIEKELEAAKEKHKVKVSDIVTLTEWGARPTNINEYYVLGDLGTKQERILLHEKEIDLHKAHIDLEKAEFAQQKMAAEIVESWYKIKHQRFTTSEELSREIKIYDEHIIVFKKEFSIFEDKRRTATGRLNFQNEYLNNIKDLQAKLLAQKESFGSQEQYQATVTFFEESYKLIEQQVTITSKLIEIYSKLLVTIEHSLRQSRTMRTELNRVRLWHRSGGAISRDGIVNLIPDIRMFISDIRILGLSYLSGLSVSSVFKGIIGLFSDPLWIIILLIQLFFLFLIFFFFYRYLPTFSNLLLQVSPEVSSSYIASRLGVFFILFLHKYLLSIFIWITLFISLEFFPFFDLYPTILFYLFSIPYFLYIAYKLVLFFREFNEEREFIFFNERFQERFITFLRWFLYSTVVILLFREAFILATYTRSELPDILLAVYYVTFKLLLLSLVRKEDLLTLIPTKKAIWAAVWRLVDRYYYPVLLSLIVIMIMTDQHIGGYNNLVSYLIWGFFGTVLIIKIVFEFYVFIRRSSVMIFFSSNGEILRERFSFAKTFYGLSVILLFFVFTLLGGLWISWVWGSPISVESIIDFFQAGRLTISLGEGQFQKLSILDVFLSFSFIPLGFMIAFLIEKFVLHRIFSVLLVNPGVHNAITTISYYVIVLLVITMGLWGQGFRFLIAYLVTPILLGIVWALKDVFNDFVGYFIILIQRPLKVGDYIKIDPETCGVVRSISPRAVVLRRKKGFCVIIPNSRIIRETIVNWDYNLNFIALPDILIDIVYAANPTQARDALIRAIDSNVNVLKTPPPIIRLDNFGEYGYKFMVRGFIGPEKTLEQWNIASQVRIAIVELLAKEGIKIAFPVRVIRLSKEDKGKLFNIDHHEDEPAAIDFEVDTKE